MKRSLALTDGDSPKNVVLKAVVAGECYEASAGNGQREKHLIGSIVPHLEKRENIHED